jgi:endonuclease YncB( thermonuclease family)
MRSRIFLVALLLSAFPFASQAASPTIRDGGTLQLGTVTYRLDSVDAPAFDQLCIDEHADSWTCGIEARDQLSKLIAGRPVHCDDLGPDPLYKKRHIGLCSVDGEKTSLNQAMVKQGFALNVEPAAKGRFKDEEAGAKDSKLGLWKGCFVAPHEFRVGRKDGALLGSSCPANRDREIRAALFPEEKAQPPGCSIKGKYAVRARVTGNLGIYHLQACRSYPGLTEPDRWFCSEDDAQGAGFRRAYNCRAPKSK